MNYERKNEIKNDKKNEFFSNVRDHDLQSRLGLKNGKENLKSYGKILYNHGCFGYDDESIYLIDKLEISFKSYDKIKGYHPTNEKQYYHLDNEISIIKSIGKEKQFYYEYEIHYNGILFGSISFHNTRNRRMHKVSISNETLYSFSKLLILSIIYRLASHFDLVFSNVKIVELARDSTTDYYDKFLDLYSYSNYILDKVHKKHGTNVRYLSFGKAINFNESGIVFRDTTKSYRTYTFGSKKSDAQVKIYTKSQELKKWKEEKSYISEIHQKHFGNHDTISRVEVIGGSAAIKKRGLDLLDLLNPLNHSNIFMSFLGNKLKFHDLKKPYYTKSRNRQFEIVDLIDSKYIDNTNTINIPLSKRRTTTRNQYNKFQNMIHMYLDEEHSWQGIFSFLKCNMWGQPVSREKYSLEIDKALKQYKGIVLSDHIKKITFVKLLLNSDGAWHRLIKVFLWHRLVQI